VYIEMYIDVLRRLRDVVRSKHPEKWRIESWFILHNNAPANWSVLVKGFIAKNNVITLEHPHSPELVPAEFNLFPRLKSSLKGWRCCDATDIIKNATEELKGLSQNGLQGSFQHLYSHWQKCIVA